MYLHIPFSLYAAKQNKLISIVINRGCKASQGIVYIIQSPWYIYTAIYIIGVALGHAPFGIRIVSYTHTS